MFVKPLIAATRRTLGSDVRSCAFAGYRSNSHLEQPRVSGMLGQWTSPDLVLTA